MEHTEVRRQWAERSGEYSPGYYAYYGPNDTSEAIRAALEQYVDRDAAVLELGCSVGRHLSHLHDHGFEHLSGVDVNDDAFDVMRETYPDLAETGTFYHDTIENLVATLDDREFDVVFSVETLQHVHPDAEWVFDELVRITGDLLITVENEGAADRSPSDPDMNYVNDEIPLYYRDWNSVFTELGLVEVGAVAGDRDTMRTFRRP